MQNAEVTVIIPNYNGMKWLPACMEALSAQTAACFDTLVVENASTDGSAEWLAAQQIPMLREEKNLGFAGGVNAGIRAVTTPYVILLNNDTKADPHFVEALLTAIKRSRRIFSVSARMRKADAPETLDDAGDGMNLLGWAYQRGVGEAAGTYPRQGDVFSACGGAAIYRREIFEEIGYFDETHFAYLEDIDIGWRAKLYGYFNRYEPKAEVLHYGSATSGSRYNDFKVRLAARNNIWLHYKNQLPFQLLINFPWLFLGALVKLCFFAKKGYLKAYVSGIAEGFAELSGVHRVPETPYTALRALAVQWEMVTGTFSYVLHYAGRKKILTS